MVASVSRALDLSMRLSVKLRQRRRQSRGIAAYAAAWPHFAQKRAPGTKAVAQPEQTRAATGAAPHCAQKFAPGRNGARHERQGWPPRASASP